MSSGLERDDHETPVCPCGRAMRLEAWTLSWACPATLDDHGWGRPKKGHISYYSDEDFLAGRPPEEGR